MKYARFDSSGRVACVYNDDTVTEVPVDAYILTSEQWEQRTALVLVDGEVLVSSPPGPGEFYQWNGVEWVLDLISQDSAITAQAYSLRDFLLRSAAIRIAPLQDALELGEATESELDELRAWKSYRVQLGRIAQHPGFPSAIEWPEIPVSGLE